MKYKTITPSREISLLIDSCQSLCSQEENQSILDRLSKPDLDHEALIALAYQHAVFPLLYRHVKNLDNQAILKRYKLYALNIRQKNMAMSVALIKITHLLHKNTISSLSFKGLLLAYVAYDRDIGARQFGDIDILIRKEDREKVIQLLLKEGYIPEIKCNQKTHKTILNKLNVLGFHSPSLDTFIEIHWELIAKNYAISWNESSLWHQKETIDFHQHMLHLLSPQHHLLYLCMHGSKHLFERLSWVCDIDRFVRAHPSISWLEMQENAKLLGVTGILLLSLDITQKLFALPLPKEIQQHIDASTKIQKLSTEIIMLQFSHTPKAKSYQSFLLLLKMREKTKDKITFIFYALFYPKIDDIKYLQLPHTLAFLYPLVRPVRLLIKYIR